MASDESVTTDPGATPAAESLPATTETAEGTAAAGDTAGATGPGRNGSEGKYVPYDRFNEVIRQRNQAEQAHAAEIAALKAQLAQTSELGDRLREAIVPTQAADLDPLDAIRGDPIVAIVREIRGELTSAREQLKEFGAYRSAQEQAARTAAFNAEMGKAMEKYPHAEPAAVAGTWRAHEGKYDLETIARHYEDQWVKAVDAEIARRGLVPSQARRMADPTTLAALTAKANPKTWEDANRILMEALTPQ